MQNPSTSAMKRLKESERGRSLNQTGWRKVNVWSVKGPLLLAALLVGFFEHDLHWGGAAIAAGVAVLIPILGFRDFWADVKFWISVFLLSVAQVPLVLLAKPFTEKLGFPFTFTFGILDCALMLLAISWVCTGHLERNP